MIVNTVVHFPQTFFQKKMFAKSGLFEESVQPIDESLILGNTFREHDIS